MAYTLFISDLHLDPSEPAITQAFKDTLAGPAKQADALYILGDLFEAWIGDGDNSPFNRDIIAALHDFTENTKIPTYFMRGNRDFLIGNNFAKQTGITLLEDPTLITLYGKRVLLLHGDSLCTLDTHYQAFRKKREGLLFKFITHATPLFLRRKIAQKMRERSKQHQRNIADTIMDVSPREVERFFKEYNADIMIHGHTHKPAIHDNHRIVLGAWHETASMLYFYDDQAPKLHSSSL